MSKVAQEVMITFRDEFGNLTAVGEQNGNLKLYWARKMNKDDQVQLLMENNPVEPK